MLIAEEQYYVAYIDMALDVGRIRGGVKLCVDIHERVALREKLKRSQENAEDRELDTWYDDGRSLILFSKDKTDAYSAYLNKLAMIEDRLFKYSGLLRRAVNQVDQIKQTMRGEQEMLARYTPELRTSIKGALVDLSSDLGEQLRSLLTQAMAEIGKQMK